MQSRCAPRGFFMASPPGQVGPIANGVGCNGEHEQLAASVCNDRRTIAVRNTTIARRPITTTEFQHNDAA